MIQVNEIMVSVICTAYNHEKYIEDALMGFISQKVNFKIEILINDDLSTDNTARIIKKYERRYPEIIKAYYQEKNLYSQGVSIADMLCEKARGKYIALCEGDDYWSDPLKLQKQVDCMEVNPQCTFCFTNAIEKDMKNNRESIMISEKDIACYGTTQKYDLSNIYELTFIPTASFMFPRSNYMRFNELFYKKHIVGDLVIELFSISLGYAYFLNENTVVYRRNVPGSATTKWKNNTKKQMVEHFKKYIEIINDVDEFSEYKYSEPLLNYKNIYYRGILMHSDSVKVLAIPELKKAYDDFSLIQKLKFHIKLHISDEDLNIYKKIRSSAECFFRLE